MKTGSELIADERQRQLDVEGWTPEHDNKYAHNELVHAAICYADFVAGGELYRTRWPWAREWWKPVILPLKRISAKVYEKQEPATQVRNLVKAGALIAAEIDRIQQLGTQSPSPNEPNIKLLPCPFCGYEASITEIESAGLGGRITHIVGCNSEDCDVSFHGHARKVDAAKAWNARAMKPGLDSGMR